MVTTIVDGVEQPPESNIMVSINSEFIMPTEGRYTFEQVPAGRYPVWVGSNSYGTNDPRFDCLSVDIPENELVELDIIVLVTSSQSPDGYSMYAAEMVEGGAPVVPPTPISMEPGPKARISGLVTTIVEGKEQQVSQTSIGITLRAQRGVEGKVGYGGTAFTSGMYVIEEVQAGDYLLSIRNPFGFNDSLNDCLTVHVPEGGDIELDILVTVTGPAPGSGGEYEIHAEIMEH